jgi:hypothetical protein
MTTNFGQRKQVSRTWRRSEVQILPPENWFGRSEGNVLLTGRLRKTDQELPKLGYAQPLDKNLELSMRRDSHLNMRASIGSYYGCTTTASSNLTNCPKMYDVGKRCSIAQGAADANTESRIGSNSSGVNRNSQQMGPPIVASTFMANTGNANVDYEIDLLCNRRIAFVAIQSNRIFGDSNLVIVLDRECVSFNALGATGSHAPPLKWLDPA